MTREDVALEVLQALIIRAGFLNDAEVIERDILLSFKIADAFLRVWKEDLAQRQQRRDTAFAQLRHDA